MPRSIGIIRRFNWRKGSLDSLCKQDAFKLGSNSYRERTNFFFMRRLDMNLAPLALNGRFSGTPQPTGTQTVAFHLHDAILRAKRERPAIVFADPRFSGVEKWADLPGTTLVKVPFQDWSRRRAQLWEQIVFPVLARYHGCVLAHHPITTCPRWQLGVRTVVTLHDLNFYLHPEWVSRSFRLVLQFFALPGIRRADRVVTVSDYVRNQALEHLRVDPGKVKRIYNGVKFRAHELMARESTTQHPPYILSLGSFEPHKNLARLIRTYDRLRAEFPRLELWIAGRAHPTRFRPQPDLAGLLQAPSIKLLGYLGENELMETYRLAQVFCFPSLEEGFGLPLLEAMQAGTLVLTSRTSCLPEIAGPACELVDPFSETSIAEGLRRLLTLPEADRHERIAQGRAWSDRFTWQRAAEDYLALFEELLA
jgi:glycosyltransferase involved in cell wall biosynthesis